MHGGYHSVYPNPFGPVNADIERVLIGIKKTSPVLIDTAKEQ